MDSDDEWLNQHEVTEEPEPTPAEAAAAADAAKKPEEPVEEAWRAIAREILKDLPPKPKPLQHWARPRFLHYDYLYNYMHNYYDDVIDYLDKKQRGIACEKPRPQIWAERVLRTQVRPKYPSPITWRSIPVDPTAQALLNTPHWANTWHSVHSKDYYNRKYKAILF